MYILILYTFLQLRFLINDFSFTISTNDYNIKYRFISIKPAQNSFPSLHTITHVNRFQRYDLSED